MKFHHIFKLVVDWSTSNMSHCTAAKVKMLTRKYLPINMQDLAPIILEMG